MDEKKTERDHMAEWSALEFGGIKIPTPLFLAPMAGYTDSAMRTLCLEQGAGAVYSELVSSEGLRRDSLPSFAVLDTVSGEHPIAGHLFGADSDAMAEAARRVEQTGRFDWIDINCGCPVKKVVSRGAGAALLKDLPRMGKIIEAVKSAVSLPVSVKTRIGFYRGTENHLEIARIIEESGADLLAVHARFAKNFHAGEADWEKLGEMKRAISIPLVGNGGVQRVSDAQRLIREQGLDGAMIGRAAIGNPWVFNPSVTEITLSMRRDMVKKHLRRLLELNIRKQALIPTPHKYTPEQAACIQFRVHLPLYIKGLFDKKRLLCQLPHLLSIEVILHELDLLLEKNRQKPTPENDE